MADVEEHQFQSLAERIAALNQQKNFQAPESKGKRAPPPPPPTKRPAPDHRSQTMPVVTSNGSLAQRSPTVPPRPSKSSVQESAPPLPRRTTGLPNGDGATSPSLPDRIAPPPLPGRGASQQVSPALPPRRPSNHSAQELDVRRKSTASEISQISTLSSLSLNQPTSSTTSINSADGPLRKLPPAFDQANLPPLPPTRRELEAKAKEAAENEASLSLHPLTSTKSAPVVRQIEPAPRPSLPPRLPSRPTRSPAAQQAEFPSPTPTRRLPPPPATYVKAPTTNGNSARGGAWPPPTTSRDHESPPPVPLSSRPTTAQIDAASARAETTATNTCLICRDFSEPDRVASQYPRQSLPRDNPTAYLARVLCGPFPSLTDKARAIFTWFHYNIEYDCAAFFGGCVQYRTAEDTIASGKAVCAGYAETYKAIANKAGLECVMVTGHGKGIGHSDLKKGERPPPRDPTGHAWNAVRIDGGQWKLLDACWGAGQIQCGTQIYKANLNPLQFTSSNERLGMKHYPENSAYFFRSDGKIPTWEEYFIGPHPGERPMVFGNAREEGVDEFSVSPAEKQVQVYSGEVVRFQFSKVCQHWTSEKHGKGKPALMLMSINGLDGRKKELIPLETDGFWWWIDIHARDLGCQGQKVTVVCLTTMQDRDARGVTAQEFLSKRGKVGMSWSSVMEWELV